MKYTYFILISLFLSCNPRHMGTTVEKELYPIYLEFLEDCESYGIDVKDYPQLDRLKTKIMDDEDLGLCISDGNILFETREVFINRGIKDEFLLKFIAYHEMGHCIFGLGHDTINEFRLMSPEIDITKKDHYIENWDMIKMEYFRNVRGNHTPKTQYTSKCTVKHVKQ